MACRLVVKRNPYTFIQENAFENVVWKMTAILSLPHGVYSSPLQFIHIPHVIWFDTYNSLIKLNYNHVLSSVSYFIIPDGSVCIICSTHWFDIIRQLFHMYQIAKVKYLGFLYPSIYFAVFCSDTFTYYEYVCANGSLPNDEKFIKYQNISELACEKVFRWLLISTHICPEAFHYSYWLLITWRPNVFNSKWQLYVFMSIAFISVKTAYSSHFQIESMFQYSS